ncbi:MAG TPA: polysaccharide biosynthesis/export family protein [Verrucomicrobiae bacterium]|jgi:protein involved in polysaccharide export with SLBB domain
MFVEASKRLGVEAGQTPRRFNDSTIQRISSFTIYFLPGLCALALLAGCGTTTGPRFDAHAATAAKIAALTNLATVALTNAPDSALLQLPTEHFRLGPGDSLEIQLVDETATPTTAGNRAPLTTTIVGPDGKIYFNLLPGLDVWGLTLPETKALIENELTKFVREKPQVSVTLRGVASRQVWLLGRLSKPGIYPLAAPVTLLEALAQAGGPISPPELASLGNGPMSVNFSEDLADLHRSFVIRNGQVLPVDFYRLLKLGDMTQNIYLQPDDFVYVPSAMTREVFVLGAVFQPKSVSYRREMSLVAAIAGAQGTIKDAYLSHVAIVRGSLTKPEIAVVDYKEILKGKSSDVLLEPGDIVYVPYVPYRTLERYANLILNTFVSTVAINEGARAVTRNFAPVGVSIGGGAAH